MTAKTTTTTTTNTNTNNNDLLRPTEAQLRWAQFHHKRRATGVRDRVEQVLYQTPAGVEDVEGALPEDGNSTTELSSCSETTTIRRIRTRRPKVSKGRRALLRVSRRTYRQRQEEIQLHGFRGKRIVDADCSEDEEDAMNEIFLTKTTRKRRRRGGGNKQTDESYKRFQAACHAMMMSITASATPNHSIEAPTKKWTRTADHIAAASLYDEYMDPKWGIRRRPQHGEDPNQASSVSQTFNLMPLDRAASWMMHLPKAAGGTRHSPYYNDMSDVPNGSLASSDIQSEVTTSTLAMRAPGQNKFNQLVALVQQRMIQKEAEQDFKPGPAPKMHLRQFASSDDTNAQKVTSQGYPVQTATEDLETEEYSGNVQRKRQNKIEQKRKTNYIPRMRLRDFLPDGASAEAHEQAPSVGPTGTPRMKLRDFEAAKKAEPRRLSRAQEIAQSLEAEKQKTESKTRKMAKSFEGDKTPKMRLRNFDFGQEGDGDEKKVSEESSAAPRRKVHPLSDRFQNQNSSDQCCARCSRPSPVASMTQSDFFASVRVMNSTPENKTGGGHRQSSTDRVSDFFSQVRKINANDAIQASSSRVTEFFSKSRPQDASDAEEPQGGRDLAANARNSDFFARVRQMHATDTEGYALCQHCLEDDAVAAANGEGLSGFGGMDRIPDDDGKSETSAISGIWNRGRSSFNTIASKLNSISEKNPIPGASLTPRTSASTPGGNVMKTAANVSGRMGGFFQNLRGNAEEEQNSQEIGSSSANARQPSQPENLDLTTPKGDTNDLSALAGFRKSLDARRASMPSEEEQNSENDYAALAGYRKTQQVKRDSMSPEDDNSSLSSYRALPDNIREMVKSKTGSPAAALDPQGGSFEIGRTSSQISRLSTLSPGRSSIVSRTTIEDMSPQKYKQLHEKVIQGYANAETEKSIIDTDGTSSDVSELDPAVLASLMLSPDLLTKRHHQAIRAIEMREWDQVDYLINANPWLVEMSELTTNQYLLHKIAFFGAAEPLAPEDLCLQMIEKFPAAMHKFDQDGNVPLHLAAAAGHMKMIRTLGERFESGASIRNEDGMLPLHFAIASYGATASPPDQANDNEEDNPSPILVIKTVLQLFPQAVAIADNDGNLPLHVAVECLEGGVGMDVIYLLLDEADRQLQDPFGARFRHKVKLEDIVNDDMSVATMLTERETDSVNADGDVYCNMIKNDFDETALVSAIHNHRGWEIIDALVSGPGGRGAALSEDADKNNALHLLVGDYQDPTAAMSILKLVPETAGKRNSQGMLPIEVACMDLMPDEVILAIALVDLPFDIEDKDAIKISKELGASWWFLVCECDDHYFEIVANILSICSFQQRRALGFMEGRSSEQKGTVISRATPKCRELLTQGLRFVGRFEFVGNSARYEDPAIGLREFDALDFGGMSENANSEYGRKVTLKCYTMKQSFLSETDALRELQIDSSYMEEVLTFGVHEGPESEEDAQQYCVSIEAAPLTLSDVMDGMIKKGGYRHDANLQKKYTAKICYVLRAIGKALNHLHEAGTIHGNLCLENCGKFEQSWKLRGRLGLQKMGGPFNMSKFHQSFPPEALTIDEQEGAVYDSDDALVSFRSNMTATPAIDIWAFGKLAYEAIVGQAMINFDSSKPTEEDIVSLLEVAEWNEENMRIVFENLLENGVPESGAEMITSCLFPRPEERPTTMRQILENPFWRDMRRFREHTKRGRRHGDDATSSVYTETTRSMYTETSEI